uniref:Secreted protein n=1 Tax=Setaria viridis TaxID=4556 RepID=A0A4U6SSL2_SETVI|nr:hypothetical protein SEVIR_9G057666v2 [Setaria viridis]
MAQKSPPGPMLQFVGLPPVLCVFSPAAGAADDTACPWRVKGRCFPRGRSAIHSSRTRPSLSMARVSGAMSRKASCTSTCAPPPATATPPPWTSASSSCRASASLTWGRC